MRNDFSMGGVVTDSAGRVALIRTSNARGESIWGLPKGHPKAGESPHQTALRETEEETGLRVSIVGTDPAGTVEYVFVAGDGVPIHKRVDFYRMRAIGGDISTHDDEVEEVTFLEPAAAVERLTYDNERHMLERILS